MAEKARQGKVTVVGAGFYGSTTALRLAEYDVFETVVLTDIVEGKPEGIALDMNQSRPIEGFETKVVGVGGGSYEGTEGSDVVVITAGLPRKPGMSRMDLIETNAKIVRSGRREHRADLAGRRGHRRLQPARRDDRAGAAGHRVPEEPGAWARPACSTPRASPTTSPRSSASRSASVQDADPRLARRHHGAGALALHRRRQAAVRRAGRRTGSSTWSTAPATAGPRSSRCSRPARRTTRRPPPPPAWPRPSMEDSGAVMPVCAWVDGEYGITGVYLGVEAEIGREGVTQGRRGRPDRERAGRAARGGRGRARQAGRRRRPLSRCSARSL